MIPLLPLPDSAAQDNTKSERKTDSVVEFRVLTLEEIESVRGVFEAQGAPVPKPETSTFVGAVAGKKVLGFIVLQLQLHAEPAWLEAGHSDLFMPMIQEAEKTILRKVGPALVYVFAPAGRITQLARAMGMQLEPWCVLSKVVVPEIPKRFDPLVWDLVQAEEPKPEPEPIPISAQELEEYPGTDLYQGMSVDLDKLDERLATLDSRVEEGESIQ